MHLYTLFHKTLFLEYKVGVHLLCYYPYYSCLCTYTIPTYFLNIIIYCSVAIINIVIDPLPCGKISRAAVIRMS